MNDAPYDNPRLRDGVADYTGNSRGRRGGQPLLIRPDKYKQLIGGLFWAEVQGEDGDQVFINDGYMLVSDCRVTTFPPTIIQTYQLISDDTETCTTAGDIVSLQVTRNTTDGSSSETFPDNDGDTITSRQLTYNLDSVTYIVTNGFPADSAQTCFFPIARWNGPFDITQLHFGIINLPYLFASSVADESP